MNVYVCKIVEEGKIHFHEINNYNTEYENNKKLLRSKQHNEDLQYLKYS